MCGIAGVLGPADQTAALLPPMLDVITHRGPDDAGEYVGQDFAFGMRRLSIIDIATGQQPLPTPDVEARKAVAVGIDEEEEELEEEMTASEPGEEEESNGEAALPDDVSVIISDDEEPVI